MAEIYTRDSATRWPWRGVLLFVLPLPLVAVAVQAFSSGDTARLVEALGALGCIWLGAVLNRTGLKAEIEFERRSIATAPKTPRKTLAALLVGAGVFICTALLLEHGLIAATLAGALATTGALLAYGADPRHDKGIAAGGHGYSTEEIVAALTEAEGKIDAIESAGQRLRNVELSRRLTTISAQAREILKVIEADPGDLRRARKFLNVYLDGTRSVAEGYAKTHLDMQSDELEHNFRNVLQTIETSFAETREKLLQDDVMDLDVQIEVLNTQLKHEGVL